MTKQYLIKHQLNPILATNLSGHYHPSVGSLVLEILASILESVNPLLIHLAFMHILIQSITTFYQPYIRIALD